MTIRPFHVQMSVYGQWATLSAHETSAQATAAMGDVVARHSTASLRILTDEDALARAEQRDVAAREQARLRVVMNPGQPEGN